MTTRLKRAALALLGMLCGCSRSPPAGPEPHQIRLVGAGVGLPFSAAAAEDFMRAQADAIAPLVRADGSTAGIARFCGGTGVRHPDLVIATRMPTAAETGACNHAGVARIAAIPFGWSALVLVTRRDTPAMALTRADLWRALTGTAIRWRAVNPALPDLPIMVHGPAPRPALADGLFDRMLRPGCIAAGGACGPIAVRTDHRYVAHGADADLVARAVAATSGSIGIVGYADALHHADALRMLALDGVMPTAATIASARYPARLPLVLMVKSGEAPAVPGMPALLGLFGRALAPGGRFAALGLVPLAPRARDAAIARLDALAAARL